MKEILLVEDSAYDAEQVQRVLERLEVCNPVRWLKDGAAARNYLSSIESTAGAPAIMLLDIKLPFFSGFEILQSIRGNPFFERTLRIIFSSLDDTSSIKQAYVLGADSFLVKPADVEDLRGVITSFPAPWLFNSKRTAAEKCDSAP